jgi:hypothetical protein
MVPPLRFSFKIDPKTPVRDLLPTPPKVTKIAGPLQGDDLNRVPEVEFQAPIAKDGKALEKTARTIAHINHLNSGKADAFLEELRRQRSDLGGLPFAMGDACRTRGKRSKCFAQEVALIRRCLAPGPIAVSGVAFAGTLATPPLEPPATTNLVPAPIPTPAPAPPPEQAVRPIIPAPSSPQLAQELATQVATQDFWTTYEAAVATADRAQASVDRSQREHVLVARVAALMQVLAPESASVRLGLVKYLATISHVEATKALARLALFSAEDEVRNAAVEALKVRRERDYTEILLQGFRYPLPAVARRAADALIKLERIDLAPRLVDLLEEPDPRAPVARKFEGKECVVVKELVKINHHKNCLMCHAPGNTGTVAAETLTAGVPIPNEPLPQPSNGYNQSNPDTLVRIDVTYLRQDFSQLQAVGDAAPWPEMQRFDFLVRMRPLAEEEAKVWQEKLTQRKPGQVSPYHRAVLSALRELTGKDAAPTADAWRKLLNQD